jgi:hypothetical protein
LDTHQVERQQRDTDNGAGVGVWGFGYFKDEPYEDECGDKFEENHRA